MDQAFAQRMDPHGNDHDDEERGGDDGGQAQRKERLHGRAAEIGKENKHACEAANDGSDAVSGQKLFERDPIFEMVGNKHDCIADNERKDGGGNDGLSAKIFAGNKTENGVEHGGGAAADRNPAKGAGAEVHDVGRVAENIHEPAGGQERHEENAWLAKYIIAEKANPGRVLRESVLGRSIPNSG